MRLEFATANRILFGAGTLMGVGQHAAGMGGQALIVCGDGLLGELPRLTEVLESNRIEWTHFVISREPQLAEITLGVQACRAQGCDLVIGFGGGSALDGAKAIAALANNPGSPLDYLEVVGKGRALINAGLPVIAIPTTAGTGSEVTRNAVISVPDQQVKVSLRHVSMLPRLALIDPELTLNLPPAVTASTGMDALAQVIEPYVSRKANWMTDLYCADGIRRGARALPKVMADGHDLEARTEMCWMSLMGGLALANAGLGAVHGFAGPLGGMFPAPHGAVCAALLPGVVQMNVQALRSRAPDHIALRRYAEIATWLTGRADAQIADGVAWLQTLVDDLQIPRLSAYGMRVEDIPAAVEKATRASSMQGNPIVLLPDELAEILRQAL